MRAPAWNRSTRVPKALKIDATCTPVAPAPSTIIEAGIDVSDQASLCVAVSSKPGTSSRRLTPPVQTTILVGAEAQAALRRERVCVEESRRARVFVHGDARCLELPAERSVLAHVVDDLTHAQKEPRIIERRLADGDPEAPELLRVADEPRRVRQRAHRYRPVVRRHATDLAGRDERRARAEVSRAQGRDEPRRSGPNDSDVDDDVETLVPAAHVAHVRSSASQRSARSPGKKPYSPPRVTTKR